jgi:3-methyladenine DNA glycosylase AlkD
MFHPEEAPVTAGLTTSAKASAVRRSFTRRRKAGRYRAAGEKARVIRELEKMSRPAGDFDPSRYFRGAGDLAFYKVGTTAMRALARQVHANHRDEWSIDDAMALADALIVEPHLETKSVGIEIVARYRRDFTPRLLPAWKRWLASNHSANWATTDSICSALIGPLMLKHPGLAPTMRAWARHRNMWVRRAAAVGLIPSVRQGLALDLGYEVAKQLHPDKEDLIQKAVGWMLREAGKTDPARLERYLRANRPSIPRTTLRYAIERFSVTKRRQLLAATRRPVLDTRERLPRERVWRGGARFRQGYGGSAVARRERERERRRRAPRGSKDGS